jgi:hypothetical protein
MRYFIDTEFSETPGKIDLISIAIAAEDGREFYAEVLDFDDSSANEWVAANVLPHLWRKQLDVCNDWSLDGGYGGLFTKRELSGEISRFVTCKNPEFWGYYADYDWVVFCWLFGSMVDLPEGWPMYCKDYKQLIDDAGLKISQPVNVHHALLDAAWLRDSFKENFGAK